MILGIGWAGNGRGRPEHDAIFKIWAQHKCKQLHNDDPLWSLFLSEVALLFHSLFGHWWVVHWHFRSSLTTLKTLFQSNDCHHKTNHSICEVAGFPYGWCFTYSVPPLPYCNTSVLYSGNSFWLIFVFNNLINFDFLAKIVVTWHAPFLDHFFICWTGHVPAQILERLCWWPPSTTNPFFSGLLPVTWSFEDLYPMAG